MELDGFERGDFGHAGRERVVFRRGQGPGVLVMHELPGITPSVAGFARRVADAGFTVALPVLFGEPGRAFSVPYLVESQLRVCVSREFHLLASHEASPITEWLRALGRALHEELGGPGIGAVGMCVTGNFALALMADPWLLAPVLSQPSLPLPVGRERRAALHVSDAQLATLRRRAAGDGVPVLGLRFTHDPLCPGARFARLRRELGERFESVEIDSSPGNPHGLRPRAHSVLTHDFVDREGHPTRAALERTLAFLAQALRTA